MIALVFWCIVGVCALWAVVLLTFLVFLAQDFHTERRERQYRRVAATTRVILYPERHRTVHAELATKRAPRR